MALLDGSSRSLYWAWDRPIDFPGALDVTTITQWTNHDRQFFHDSRLGPLSRIDVNANDDSPTGLLAWTSQLFTDFGSKVDMVERDRFLTDFMIYWLTNTAGSSIRYYLENANDPTAWAPKANSDVPTGVFEEGDVAIRYYAEKGNTIVRWTEHEKGSHYAALEVPSVWTKDVQEFFCSLRGIKLADMRRSDSRHRQLGCRETVHPQKN